MMKKFIRHDLGPRGLGLEEWVSQCRVVSICVDNARCVRIFEILKYGVVLCA